VTVKAKIMRVLLREDLNFLLTNRLPRRLATRAVGRLSRIETPVVRRPAIAMWRFFAEPDLSDAAERSFGSLHHAFTRALKVGARAFDPDPAVVASPCDAIVGSCGRVEAGRLYQVKGRTYGLSDLLLEDAAEFRDGSFATLRLTAGMYHRFHAPHGLRVESVRYVEGDAWNVNRAALNRVDRLYCRNERAIIRTRLAASDRPLLMVPVSAILVAGIRLTFLDTGALLRRGGPRTVPCDVHLTKGEEMGWFEHGSTIILLAPPGFALAESIAEGTSVRAGEALMRVGTA